MLKTVFGHDYENKLEMRIIIKMTQSTITKCFYFYFTN